MDGRSLSVPRIERVPLLRRGTEEDLISTVDRRSQFYRMTRKASVTPGEVELVTPSLFNIPNVLTIARVIMVPLFALLYDPRRDIDPAFPFYAALCFLVASLTDWLDGMLARMLGLVSAFGAFLDPVADKIMVSTALIYLAVDPPAPITPAMMAVPASLMIGREISMSALREWAAASSGDAHKAVKVNTLGKWKTVLQMSSMTVLLFARRLPVGLFPSLSDGEDRRVLTTVVAFAGLWGAALLTVASFVVYFKNAWEHFFAPVPVRRTARKKTK
ncbi:unnamed protein product [Pedinophyceae sp. YPF-701]|nr:unnamed protein product [Pedinophyceae sp. YPF-701]